VERSTVRSLKFECQRALPPGTGVGLEDQLFYAAIEGPHGCPDALGLSGARISRDAKLNRFIVGYVVVFPNREDPVI